MKRTHQELETLSDLLGDFGTADFPPDRVDDAFELIADRSRMLADQYIEVAGVLSELKERKGIPLSTSLRRLLFIAHEYLFGGVLTNAGMPRHQGEPLGGRIFFGGSRGDRREMRFTGARPETIDRRLEEAFAHLVDLREDELGKARDNAILFYADLSLIHPFYDGNGRTGRFVVSIYLQLHGWMVEWSRIDESEGRFMRKINNYNQRKSGQQDYAQYLKEYWRRHVVPIADFE